MVWFIAFMIAAVAAILYAIGVSIDTEAPQRKL
ncbi:hypothetical protein HNQ60_004987 [Povalibacter uvarum]|uniref:Uncharacterized protein n=1 Tax=Povalibacter uvarum TaxID=732238 RepID=A0A841HT85_9GAMM|nr:hypothetical protein [Povalibacter uvarum]